MLALVISSTLVGGSETICLFFNYVSPILHQPLSKSKFVPASSIYPSNSSSPSLIWPLLRDVAANPKRDLSRPHRKVYRALALVLAPPPSTLLILWALGFHFSWSCFDWLLHSLWGIGGFKPGGVVDSWMDVLELIRLCGSGSFWSWWQICGSFVCSYAVLCGGDVSSHGGLCVLRLGFAKILALSVNWAICLFLGSNCIWGGPLNYVCCFILSYFVIVLGMRTLF
ncbi:hypothetical protein ACE6H2_007343 [Prunus campanulata]